MAERADIIDTGSRWARAGRIVIDAPPGRVFDLLADPVMHPILDGSGTVLAAVSGPVRLSLGSSFRMDMHLAADYRIDNKVVEFEEGRRIAWQHFGRHRWRFELVELGDGRTQVTETFDARPALCPPALLLMDAYRKNQIAVLKTLVRLKRRVEAAREVEA